MTTDPQSPSDWVSGERVFAPPRGTVDVDWLVPAVRELVPGTTAAQARAVLEQAWLRRRAGTAPAGDGSAGPGPAVLEPPAPTAPTALARAAEAVLAEALATFGD